MTQKRLKKEYLFCVILRILREEFRLRFAMS